MKSDYDGLAGLSSLAGRFTYSAAERAAVIKELRSITWSGIKEQMGNGLASFMDQAQKNAVLVNFGQADPLVDDFTARVYVDGYAMGFSTEQIVSFSLTAAAAAKVGTVSKAALLSWKGTAPIVYGVSALSKFKTRAIAWIVAGAKNNVVTEAVAKTAGTMVEKVANLPTLINGKTVGQIIGEEVANAGALYDELRLIGKPLDDFGVKAQTQLAKLLERDLGSFPGEKALRGDIKFYDSVTTGSLDRYDEFVALLTDSNGTLDKHALQTSIELYEDAPFAGAGGNWQVIGEAADPSVARQLTPNACGCACGQTLLADRGVTVFQSNIAAKMKSVLATEDGLAEALNYLDNNTLWKRGDVLPGDEFIAARDLPAQIGSFAGAFHEFGKKISHMVIIDGVDSAGLVLIRDPWNGVAYKMTQAEFELVFTGRIVYKSVP